MIQLISLRFNYKRKRPSYPSPLDRGSKFPNKLPLVSQESLRVFTLLLSHYFSLVFSLSSLWSHQSIFFFYMFVHCEWGEIMYMVHVLVSNIGLRPFITKQFLFMTPRQSVLEGKFNELRRVIKSSP